MTSIKRPRGRPRGSCIDDTPALTQVADLMVREPSLKPTTAMKRVRRARAQWGASDETLLRRWQEKWKQHGAGLLAAARERACPKPVPRLSAADFEKIAATWRIPTFQTDPALLRALSEARSQFEKMNAEFAKVSARFRGLQIDPAILRAVSQWNAEKERIAAAWPTMPQIDPAALRAMSEWSETLKSAMEVPAIKKWTELNR